MKLKDGMQNSVEHDQTGSEAAVGAGSVPLLRPICLIFKDYLPHIFLGFRNKYFN